MAIIHESTRPYLNFACTGNESVFYRFHARKSLFLAINPIKES
jgi:hypothetical protein